MRFMLRFAARMRPSSRNVGFHADSVGSTPESRPGAEGASSSALPAEVQGLRWAESHPIDFDTVGQKELHRQLDHPLVAELLVRPNEIDIIDGLLPATDRAKIGFLGNSSQAFIVCPVRGEERPQDVVMFAVGLAGDQ